MWTNTKTPQSLGNGPGDFDDGDDEALSPDDVAFIQRFLLERSGNTISLEQGYLVESRLAPVAEKYRVASVSELITELREPPPQLAVDVVDALTATNTSFILQDTDLCEAIVDALQEAVDALDEQRPLVIWSAACSTGQEAFSLAILLNERFPELVGSGQVKVLATDLSPTTIKRCSAARYSRFEINRGIPPTERETYFQAVDRVWLAEASIRRLVKVKVLNLMGPWPGIPRCDMVVMRNVLPSLAPRVGLQVAQKVGQTVLRSRGVFVVGEDDSQLMKNAGYERYEQERGPCYRLSRGPHND